MQTIKLDLQRQSILTPLKTKQNDRYSRFFKLELWDNSTEFQLPEGAVFTLRYVAPSGCGWYDTITEIDGKKTHSAFSVDGSSITIELAEVVLTKPGRGAVSLQIYTVAGYRIGSWNIPIEIEEDPCSDQNIVASDYYNVLTAQVALTLQYRNAAEKAADAALKSETNAANSAGAASNSAVSANGSASNAATSAGEASTKAAAADTSAKAAKTSETNAAASAGTASAKATAADTSAKAAKTSETNAAASAGTASTKATAAANSAASAAQSASSAEQSAKALENVYTKPQADERFAPVAALTPTGAVIPFAGASAPAGWLLCDGAAVSRTVYAGLFNVIGTAFGGGNGSTTFNLPDMRGRVPVGCDANLLLGSTGGESKHKLTVKEIPAHSHELGYASTSAPALRSPSGWVDNGSFGSQYSTSTVGNGEEHNNMQPYATVTFIIKT